jgi:hypothetical protein
MRKLTSLLLVLLIGVIGVGCDSSDNMSDADKLVGTWALTNVSDSQGSALAAFAAAFSSVVLVNSNTGSFNMTVTLSAQNPADITPPPVIGTYTVNESTNTFTLNVTSPAPAPLAFTYSFTSDDVIDLTAGATTSVLLNTLFGTTLQAPAVITITRQ